MSEPRYSEIVVDLVGALTPLEKIHRVIVWLNDAGIPEIEVEDFRRAASELGKETCMKTIREWVTVKPPVDEPMSKQQATAQSCLDKMKVCHRDLKHILDKGSSGCELGLLDLGRTILRLDNAINSLMAAM